jgi:DNA (cytosine-5)-methyltransferase 1
MRKGKITQIPIIDVFAGPGGLGEGFSSLTKNSKKIFDIKLSIEKDENAHKTLELRAFVRQFQKDELPEEYYNLCRETNIAKREELRKKLFDLYPTQSKIAKEEAWLCELGNEKFSSKVIDSRIKKELNGNKNWLLIGGPPCQAYSLVGRSRVGGIAEEDHRVYLYKEYLRIIAVHHPAVFVMENVKGLLSAKMKDEKIFDWIKKDLRDSSSVFPSLKSPKYKVYSLSTEFSEIDSDGQPIYSNDRDYLIKSEEYGIPQKRHRVILLGVRQDIDRTPSILKKANKEMTVEEAIGDLPKLRSGISKSNSKDNLTKYTKEIDSSENWNSILNTYLKEVTKWNDFKKDVERPPLFENERNIGGEYIRFNTPSEMNPLKDWYRDEKLGGVCNHESRAHLKQDLLRYLFSSLYAETYNRFPRLEDFKKHSDLLMPNHKNAESGKFNDRFRTQLKTTAATTVTSHISKDGHYFIHYDPEQCRSFTVREAARIQTFPDNYLFCGPRTAQFHQVGNAVPPYLAKQIAEVVYDIFQNIENA